MILICLGDLLIISSSKISQAYYLSLLLTLVFFTSPVNGSSLLYYDPSHFLQNRPGAKLGKQHQLARKYPNKCVCSNVR